MGEPVTDPWIVALGAAGEGIVSPPSSPEGVAEWAATVRRRAKFDALNLAERLGREEAEKLDEDDAEMVVVTLDVVLDATREQLRTFKARDFVRPVWETPKPGEESAEKAEHELETVLRVEGERRGALYARLEAAERERDMALDLVTLREQERDEVLKDRLGVLECHTRDVARMEDAITDARKAEAERDEARRERDDALRCEGIEREHHTEQAERADRAEEAAEDANIQARYHAGRAADTAIERDAALDRERMLRELVEQVANHNQLWSQSAESLLVELYPDTKRRTLS